MGCCGGWGETYGPQRAQPQIQATGGKRVATVLILCSAPTPTLSKAPLFSSVPSSGWGGGRKKREKRPSWGCLTQKPSAQPSRQGFASVSSPGHGPVLSGARRGRRDGILGTTALSARGRQSAPQLPGSSAPRVGAPEKLAGRERRRGKEKKREARSPASWSRLREPGLKRRRRRSRSRRGRTTERKPRRRLRLCSGSAPAAGGAVAAAEPRAPPPAAYPAPRSPFRGLGAPGPG